LPYGKGYEKLKFMNLEPLIPEGYVTVRGAAEILGVSDDTVRRHAKKGLIKAERSRDNHRIFRIEELRRLASRSKNKAKWRVLKRPTKSPATGVSAIELFSGCGGMALGFQHAGITSELLVEIDKHACATLKKNWPKKDIRQDDVAKIDFTGYRDEIDIVAGGFPCQAFSYAGYSRGFKDTRGTLFFEFARCVNEVRPRIAVGENVKGLLKHDEGRTLETMINTLREIGYVPHVGVMRAQFLDVPQKRERLIILAVREDLTDSVPHLFPVERDYTISVGAALSARGGVKDSPGVDYPEKKRKVLEMVPEGGYWRNLPDDVRREYMGGSYFLGGGKTGMARRLHSEEPSLTLTCSPCQKQTERCHPFETRPLTTREYARIQTFPDGWKFCGGTSSIYKQIGNAVPVNLAYHLGTCLIAMLNPNERTADMNEVSEPPSEPLQLTLAI